MNNVKSLDNKMEIPDQSGHISFYPLKKLDRLSLRSTLQAPAKDSKIPENAQWLGGEGAGSWFDFELQNSQLKVTRYSPDGLIECTGYFENRNSNGIWPDNSFRVAYPSNCNIISLAKNNLLIRFERSHASVPSHDFHVISV
jgi:hypothetical protein